MKKKIFYITVWVLVCLFFGWIIPQIFMFGLKRAIKEGVDEGFRIGIERLLTNSIEGI